MEVPSEIGGIVEAILVQVGDSVAEGHAIAKVAGTSPAVPVDTAPPPEVNSAPAAKSAELASDEPAAPAAESGAAAAALEIRVPDIGEATDVVVIEVAVRPGQHVAADDLLVVVESDKASMEIPAGHPGTVLEVHVAEGSNVVEGTLLVTLAGSASLPAGAAAAAEPEPTPESTPEPAGPAAALSAGVEVAPPAAPTPASGIYAGPAVRRLARELGVDLAAVAGTGNRGRIVKDDVKGFVKVRMQQGDAAASPAASVAGIPPIPEVDFSKFGATERVPLTRIQAAGAANLQRSWLNLPHVTQHDEADVTELEAFRATLKEEATRRDVKITPLAFIIKACCYALKEFPTFNASLDAQAKHFILKAYYHIGFAVDTPEGLLVPVLKDADKKGVWELSEEIADLAGKAREQKLGMGDLQGGSFSVSSLGAIGGTGFTPIINAPEVAILGVARLAARPVWDGEAFAPRKMLPLSLSYDHRAINGAEAGRFVSYLCDLLSDIRRLTL